MALPLPPGWTQLQFNDWFTQYHNQALALRTNFILTRTPQEIMANTLEYLATATTNTPLPIGWELLEFTDWINALILRANSEYYHWFLGITPVPLQPNVKERTNFGIFPKPAPVVISFMGASVPAPATLTRASAGNAFNSVGVLTPYGNDVPRFAYNTTTLALLGLLNEQATTNGIRNSSGTGAVPGSPGTMPANWSGWGAAGGLTRTVVGTGLEDGIPYVDVRYNGTTNASTSFTFNSEASQIVAAAAGQTWVFSSYLRAVAGSFAGVTLQQSIFGRAAGGGAAGATTTTALSPVPTSAALKSQRYSVGMLLVDPTIATVDARYSFLFSTGVAIDVTMRWGGSMLCQLPTPAYTTSPILTTAAAVLRAADILTIPEPDLVAGYWDQTIKRANGTVTTQLDLTAGGGTTLVVPNDQGAVQSVTFAMSL